MYIGNQLWLWVLLEKRWSRQELWWIPIIQVESGRQAEKWKRLEERVTLFSNTREHT
jgi:hypothetical protein